MLVRFAIANPRPQGFESKALRCWLWCGGLKSALSFRRCATSSPRRSHGVWPVSSLVGTV